MGGICGYFGEGDKTLLRRMASSLRHRGYPFYFIADNMGVCLLKSKVKNVSISGEGEIYVSADDDIYGVETPNKGLTCEGPPDFEQIEKLYREVGIAFTLYLKGNYAIALADPQKKELLLVRDKMGVKPLYYTFTKYGVLFASEVKALLTHEDVKRRISINLSALDHYFTYGCVEGDITLFGGIKKLLPGSYMVLRQGKTPTLQRYWVLEALNNVKEDVNTLIVKLHERLKNCVKVRISDIAGDTSSPALMLSGGLDSSTIAYFLRNLMPDKEIEAYTIALSDSSLNEPYVEMIADELGLKLNKVKVTNEQAVRIIEELPRYYDDLIGEAAATTFTYVVIQEVVKKGHNTVFSGDGGDEIFFGYPWVSQFHTNRFLSKIPDRLIKSIQPLVKRMVNSIESPCLFRLERALELSTLSSTFQFLRLQSLFSEVDLRRIYPPEIRKKGLPNLALVNNSMLKSISNRACDEITRRYLLCLEYLTRRFGIRRLEPISSAFSINLRTPLLDPECAAFMYSVPSEYKQRGEHTKILLRRMLAQYTKLPRDFIMQTKRGFAIEEWLRKELYEYAYQGILENLEYTKSVLNKYGVIKFLNRKPRPEITSIFALLLFSLWYKYYFHN